MTIAYLFGSTNSLYFCAMTSIIRLHKTLILDDSEDQVCRFIYVTKSKQHQVSEALSRTQFTSPSMALGLFFNIFQLISVSNNLFRGKGFDRLPFPLYISCLDPHATNMKPQHKIMPLNQIIIVLMNLINVSCDIYLYKFLETQTQVNEGTYTNLNI